MSKFCELVKIFTQRMINSITRRVSITKPRKKTNKTVDNKVNVGPAKNAFSLSSVTVSLSLCCLLVFLICESSQQFHAQHNHGRWVIRALLTHVSTDTLLTLRLGNLDASWRNIAARVQPQLKWEIGSCSCSYSYSCSHSHSFD